MKKLLSVGLILLLVAGLAACQKTPDVTPSTPPEATSEASTEAEVPATEEQPQVSESQEEENNNNNQEVIDLPNPIATIEMENGGKIVVELMPKYAPNTVNNFVTLAQSGYYDGIGIHRIVPGFVIQGGDPDGTGGGGPGYGIQGEFIENGFADNKLSHTRGVISMARTMAPNSAGSQFFIVLDDAAIPSLDQKYAGFGMVLEGIEIVDQIAAVQRDSGDAPLEPVIMKSVTIDTKGIENWPAPVTVAE